ncbi:MAG: RNA-binding domain-containing protein [Anaerolineaceae bacterium]
MGKRQNDLPVQAQWRTVDLHIHTPASSDFQQPEATYLDILQRAENKGIDILAFTDHNTIAGYRKMRDEIQQLELLKSLNRLLPDEVIKLNEYQRLLRKILVLPGIEFTATFGFHILGIFSPEIPIRTIEHLLMNLDIPSDQLDIGSQTVGATTDVLTAYQLINNAGGLVIAAHANSSNGVAMRGFNFGGQTKIAYTQDENLHALEVTDLDQKGPRSTAAFFSGTKPEYPRRMHCIQGSDAHRLSSDATRRKVLGIGDRATDILLPEISFTALKDVLSNNDFSKTRPHRNIEEPTDNFIVAAQEEGSNIIQDFHESMTVRGGKLYALLADVCAFANANGGTLYIGLGNDPKKPIVGIQDIDTSINLLEKEIDNRISPRLQCTIDTQEVKSKKIIRILVPRGDDPPYALDDNKVYIRDEADTGLAVRDEIVNLVLRNKKLISSQSVVIATPTETKEPAVSPAMNTVESTDISPRTGVEVLPPEERQGKQYFTMRDLRNGNEVKNVTKTSARRLWHYAISSYNEIIPNINKIEIKWYGNFGLLKKYKQAKATHYDLIYRGSGKYQYYFGVTQDGIHGEWKNLVGEDERN